jgi:hypothetical protein
MAESKGQGTSGLSKCERNTRQSRCTILLLSGLTYLQSKSILIAFQGLEMVFGNA